LEFVVEPRLFRRSQFSGVLIIVVIVMMVNAYGLTGFLVAPPLAVALQVLVGYVAQVIRKAPATGVEFETLEERLAAVSALYTPDADSENKMPPEIASLYGRLEGLIGEARQLAREEQIPGV
jgi:hypothetical protein